MHRFFVEKNSITGKAFTSRNKELCHQLSKVLKIRKGETSTLCQNDEMEHLAEWTLISKSECSANLLTSNPKPDISTSKPLHLAVALLKNQNRWEWILEKGTELGVASFVPLITKRSEATELRKLDRLERIIKEAAEQSGRTLLPTLRNPHTFTDALEHKGRKWIATPQRNKNKLSLSENAENSTGDQTPVTSCQLLVGPEGGFTEEEVLEAINAGCQTLSFGSQTLRTETAAIVGAGMMLLS